jgi:hypothetical protein
MRLIILKFVYFYSGDVAADVDHLHVKRIYLMGFSYIVIEDTICRTVILELLKMLLNFPSHWSSNRCYLFSYQSGS